MPYIEVHKSLKKEIKTECFKRDLLWYDVRKHKMLKFYCSKLEFVMQHDKELGEYRVLPKPVDEDIERTKYVINGSSVENWFNTYANYNNTDAYIFSNSVNTVTFYVENKDLDDFAYDLERNNFRFSIEK